MSGKYKAYPEYKDSGVEWLGEIPENWGCLKLKYVANLEGDKVEAGSSQRYVGMENVQSGNGKFITTEETKPEGISTSFYSGDVLFGKLRPYLAKSWLADFEGICSSEFLVLRSHKISPKFLNYFTLTEEFINQVNSSTYGSKMPRASWDFISLMGTPVPADNLSDHIANFLDHETAKIDNLIEEQKTLIRLLQEKRQAVISHAVTKGLNPAAPMKDSGVDWLGEVPAHWDIAPLKRFSEILDCKHITAEFVDDGVPLASIREVKSWTVDLRRAKKTTQKYYDLLVEGGRKPVEGDIIYSRNATVGEAALVKESEIFAMGQDVCLLRSNKNMNSEYLLHQLKSPLIKMQLDSLLIGSTFKRINVEEIRNFIVLLPLKGEQDNIVEFLYRKTADYDLLIKDAQSTISFMQERRTALISAAVTGKIDVRDWTPPAPQQEQQEMALCN